MSETNEPKTVDEAGVAEDEQPVAAAGEDEGVEPTAVVDATATEAGDAEAAPADDEATADEGAAVVAGPARRAEARPRRRRATAPAGPQPLGPYAVIETGGKQYRVSVGDRIAVERLDEDAGGRITFDRVLLLGGDGATRVGTPVVEGAAVEATVDDHFRGDKIVVFKYKPKKRYRKRQGHRQSLTRLTITAING